MMIQFFPRSYATAFSFFARDPRQELQTSQQRHMRKPCTGEAMSAVYTLMIHSKI